jgi:uncharacterized RDD family membrane protein YckC
MKCPKCHYISFDQGDRCRNCGYEFSLSPDLTELDLPIRTGDEAVGPLADFSLGDAEEPPPAWNAPRSERPARPTGSNAARSHELPLFGDRAAHEDAPLVSLPASPRAPVAVRKSAVVRPAYPPPPAGESGGWPESSELPARRAFRPARAGGEVSSADERTERMEAASAGARLGAAMIDLLMLAAIDAAVLYCTLRLCGLELNQAARIPVVPFAAFLAVLNGGYLAAFTAAGGQSIGKMATGIKVVTMDESAGSVGVPLGQSVLRAASYLVSVLPAGAGFLPALFGAERRAFHDRLAHTRVVKA